MMENLNRDYREHIQEYNLPFQYGKNDCVIFTFNWVKRRTGIDLYSLIPYKYSTEIGALKTIKKMGAESLESFVDMFLDRVETFPPRGSIALHNGRQALGVVFGNMTAFLGPDGVVYDKTNNCSVFWRID